jgi:hypothetical protein
MSDPIVNTSKVHRNFKLLDQLGDFLGPSAIANHEDKLSSFSIEVKLESY